MVFKECFVFPTCTFISQDWYTKHMSFYSHEKNEDVLEKIFENFLGRRIFASFLLRIILYFFLWMFSWIAVMGQRKTDKIAPKQYIPVVRKRKWICKDVSLCHGCVGDMQLPTTVKWGSFSVKSTQVLVSPRVLVFGRNTMVFRSETFCPHNRVSSCTQTQNSSVYFSQTFITTVNIAFSERLHMPHRFP